MKHKIIRLSLVAAKYIDICNRKEAKLRDSDFLAWCAIMKVNPEEVAL